MRDFSKVSPSIWRSKKFRATKDPMCKMVYLYLLTCPHGNSAGCFDIDPLYASADLETTPEAFREAINRLCEVGLIEWDGDENTVWIVQWEEFNKPTNPKHAAGLLSQLEQASSEKLKSKCFHAFMPIFKASQFDRDAVLRKAIDSFLGLYPKPIITKTERRPDQIKT